MAVLAEPIERRATYADIEALPPGLNGEILAGQLVVSPRPAAPHIYASSRLGAVLSSGFDLGTSGPGGWHILHEPELSLAVDPLYDPVISDLAGWRLETLPEVPNVAQFRVTPDWVCEVLSASTARRDRLLKLPYYGRAGVRHVWLLDALARGLEVYRLEGEHYLLVQTLTDSGEVGAEPFDAVPFELGLLWPRLQADGGAAGGATEGEG